MHRAFTFTLLAAFACQPALPRPADVGDACAGEAFTCSTDGSRVLACGGDGAWAEAATCEYRCALNRTDDPSVVCCIADSENEDPTDCFPS